jgi:penicillin-binding protein 1C
MIGEITIWCARCVLFIFLALIKTLRKSYSNVKKYIFSFINNLKGVFYGYGKLDFLVFSKKNKYQKIRVPISKKPVIQKQVPKNTAHSYSFRLIILISLIFLFGGLLGFLLSTSYFTYTSFKNELPHPKLLSQRTVPLSTKIVDRNGKLLYELYSEQNRTFVPLSEIPQFFIDATIAVEDKNYYQHPGFSPKGIVRAVYKTFVKHDVQGGSTITQQLVRSAVLNRDITFARKIRELALSIWTEKNYSKNQILEMYFNQVPYGGTAWGSEAAARQYFGKSIRNVNLSEAALLAGLPAAPSRFSPFGLNPQLSKVRQKTVLRRMREDGYITEEEEKQALNQPLVYAKQTTSIRAPHFVMYVKNYLEERFGQQALTYGGFTVTTTLDIELQEKIQEIVQKNINKLENLQVGNGAVLVTNPNNGFILAMVGSKDYFDTEDDGNVNIVLTPQQPGSTIKVVTYAAALQKSFTAASLIQDSPITFTLSSGERYSPVNYDGKYHGTVTLRQALGNSYNVPAVKTVSTIGLNTMILLGKDMGISSWNDPSRYGLSLTLGGGEVTMLDMATVYGTIANGGIRNKIQPIVQVTDYQGNMLENNSSTFGKYIFSKEIGFILSDILSDNKARSNAFGVNSLLNIPNEWVAVKTGTSDTKRDNWTIGFTHDYVVTVWVGNNDNSPMHPTLTSGVTGAAPIWRDVMNELLSVKPSKKPSVPENIVILPCRGQQEYFIKGTEPKDGCLPIPTPSEEKENLTYSTTNSDTNTLTL